MMTEKHDAYYIFAGRIDEDDTKPLLEFINNHSGNLLIGLKSGGGCVGTESFLRKVFDENKERISLMVVAGVHSAAFEVFYHFKGQKYLAQEVTGMYHYAKANIDINANGRPSFYEGEAQLRNQKMLLKSHQTFAKSFMTPTEYRKFLQGQEVYFDFNRMKELFPNAQII